MSSHNELAEENRQLRQQIEALRLQWRAETGALRAQLEELELIRRNLEHAIAVYKRSLFGSRSEKIDPKELEARIAQAAQEARKQLAQEKRPGDPPAEAEEEQPEEKAGLPDEPADPPADSQNGKRRNARPARTVAEVFPRICRDDALSTRSIPPRPSARVALGIRP